MKSADKEKYLQWLIPFSFFSNAVINIISIRGDPNEILRRHDPRYDIRHRLYYARLYKENRTETPLPDPYSMLYRVAAASRGCQPGSGPWSARRNYHNSDTHWQNNLQHGSYICITCFTNFIRQENKSKFVSQ
ncbi:hypothetical protein Ciccas_009027 [Cichlidogyrus casuarinus]|uniref:Uncharacterized protein n=1 Tax=Cichlidogyrus casuarinus TaxID=1844966 RepID=A0ABD2PYF6_9PLAT